MNRRSAAPSRGLVRLVSFALAGTAGWAVARATEPPATRPEIAVGRVHRAPVLEDFLAMEPPEDLRGELTLVRGLVQRDPDDGKPASQETDVWLGHDDARLYVVFVAFDREPDKVRAHLARRENVFGDDTVEIQIDSFNDQRRAFSFLTNPLGIQWDAIWTEGQGFDESWDTVWDSRGQLTDRGYVVWMAIPFRSLRFPAGAAGQERTWRVILVRDILRNGETSFWPAVSAHVEGRLNQAALAHGFADIHRGRNVWLIPYATARRLRLAPADLPATERDATDAGVDLKWVLAESLALDLTANPDFSQVESDEPQVTVNQRFEVFFPEKRPFFLENADYFRTPIDLLFTRRIRDPLGGARLTGKLGAWSLGALLVDDEAPGKEVPPDDPLAGERAWNGVLRVRRDVSRQSSVGLLFTDRELGTASNRVGGADARVKLDDNWETKLQAVYATSRMPDGERLEDPALSLELNRAGRRFETHLHYLDVGPDFRTELGFVPRTDIREGHGFLGYSFRPEGRHLVAWGPELDFSRVLDHDGTRLDAFVEPGFAWQLRRQTRIDVGAKIGHERLRPEDAPGLAADRDYDVRGIGAEIESEPISALGFEVSLEGGRSVNFSPALGAEPEPADVRSAEIELSLRPLARLRLDATALYTRLDDRASGARILRDRVLRGRIQWQFTRRLSLRAIVQHDRTEVDPARTSEEARDEINGDVLLTYLVNPWTAVYAGYAAGYVDPTLDAPPGDPAVESAWRNEARQLFVKVSYLFRP